MNRDCFAMVKTLIQSHPSSVTARQSMRPLRSWFSSPVRGHAVTWKAKNHRGFLISTVRAQIDKANGPCIGRTHLHMRLLTSWRENLLGVSQEQGKLGDGRLANVKKAPWKSNLDLIGAVVLHGWLEMVGITFLACPMVKRK